MMLRPSLLMLIVAGCQYQSPSVVHNDQESLGKDSPSLAVEKLAKHCGSCHTVKNTSGLRFIIRKSAAANDVIESNVDKKATWDYIASETAPSGRLWASSIVDLLNWPDSGEIPQDELGVTPRFMPLGKAARANLAKEMVGERPLRKYLIDVINNRNNIDHDFD